MADGYLYYTQKLRPKRLERIERQYQKFALSVGLAESKDDVFFSIGSKQFSRESGQWCERKRRRDHSWWRLPKYAFLSAETEIVLLRLPRTTTARLWHSALCKLMTHLGIRHRRGRPYEGMSVDNIERRTWETNTRRWRRFDLRGNKFVEMRTKTK